MPRFQLKNFSSAFVRAILAGFVCGVLYGVVQGIQWLLPHGYLRYKMYRISMQYLLSAINRSAFVGILAACALCIIGSGLFLLLKYVLKTTFFTSFITTTALFLTPFFRWIKILFMLWILTNLAFASYTLIARPKNPNLIIVSVDCLRKDHLSIYGYDRPTSPNIDAFAHNATLFEYTISQSCWTIPSVASLFTSLYPSTHLTRGSVAGAWAENILNPKLVTIAELLKNEGYHTAAFMANHSLLKEYHFNQGFDSYDMIDDSSKPLAENVNKKTFSWLDKNRRKPFFIYLHYMDPHATYGAPIPYNNFFRSETKRPLTFDEFNTVKHLQPNANIWDLNVYIDLYDSEIRYVDHHIGELMQFLREKELLDNTIIVITADHGEAFLEHGFCEHGNALYREEIDVPMIVRFPKQQPFPSKVAYRVEQIDVIQSIIEILGYAYPYPIQAENITQLDNDTICYSEEPSMHHKSLPTISMTEKNFKAIYFVPKKAITDLYDLSNDPFEKNNLILEKPHLAEHFRARIKDWSASRSKDAKRLGTDNRPSSVVIDKNHIETLKALGYVR